MNCILTGVGGQGTVLASKLLAETAMMRGLPVRTAETIGMAQRGGSVVSHVRIGASPEDEVASPLVPHGTADALIGFEIGEATRMLPYLSHDGLAVVADTAIIPVTASLGGSGYMPAEHRAYLEETLAGRVVFISSGRVLEECGTLKALNVALLGAACESGALGVTLDQMSDALKKRVKPRFLEMNERALRLGAEACSASAGRWRA